MKRLMHTNPSFKEIIFFFLIFAFFLVGVLPQVNAQGDFNPNPDCNIEQIRQVMAAEGLIELPNCNDDCGMYFYRPTIQHAYSTNLWAKGLGADIASVDSQDKNDCLSQALLDLGVSQDVFIGYKEDSNPIGYGWTNKRPTDYENWESGWPDQTLPYSRYATLDPSTGTWKNAFMYVQKPSIIRVDLCPELIYNNRTVCTGYTAKVIINPIYGSWEGSFYWPHNGSINNTEILIPTQTTDYFVHYTDRYGCTADSIVSVIAVPFVEFDVNITPATCGISDGEIEVFITNFTPSASDEVQYSIDNGVTFQSNPIFTDLEAGTYFIKVKLINEGGVSCNSLSQKYTVGVIGAPPADFTFPDFCLNETNSPTNITTSGGTWSFDPIPADGATINPSTGVISNEVAGETYTVAYTVGPAACPNTHTEEVTIALPPTISSSTVNATCGNYNGEITVTSGSGTYEYSLNNGAPQTDGNFTNLAPGTYTVEVNELGGCSNTESVTISATTPPTISIVSQDNVDCNGNNNGSATVSTANGSGAYTFLGQTELAVKR